MTRPPDPYVAPDLDRHGRDRLLLESSSAVPLEGECLVCFLVRAASVGCDGDLRLVETYRSTRAPAAVGVATRWARLDARCACTVAGSVWQLAREHHWRDVMTDELCVPDPMPSCHGVRPGSAQPCTLWQRGPRRRPGSSGPDQPQARCTWGENASAIAW